MKGLPRSLARGGRRSPIIRQRVSVRAVTAVITDPGSANAPFTMVIGDLPEGNILFQGAIAYLQFTRGDTDIGATFQAQFGVGTTATADATLTGTDVNLIDSTAIAAATAGVSPVTRGSGVTQAMLDNTDGSLEINLNGYIADAGIAADSSVIVSGEVELIYTVMMDD